MLNRTAVMVCLVCAVLLGYLLSGPSARAQNVATAGPVSIFGGDDVLLQLERGSFQSEGVSSIRCRVTAMEGSWIKCGSGDAFGADRTQRWVNLSYVIQVTKYEK